MLQIILVRHGRPEAASNPTVGAAGFAKWVRQYNRSKIHAADRPPHDLCARVADCYAVSSDLRRAVHSAELCLARKPDLIISELREMEIPYFRFPFPISVKAWLCISRFSWFLGFPGKCEPLHAAKIRIASAVDIIEEESAAAEKVVVFGHGLSNRYIAKELRKRGWKEQGKSTGYWGTTELTNHKHNRKQNTIHNT